MGHRLSSRSDDDISKFRRFGVTLVVDPDYVLALYPYPYPYAMCSLSIHSEVQTDRLQSIPGNVKGGRE